MSMDTIRFATYQATPVYLEVPRRSVKKDLPNWLARAVVWIGEKCGVLERDYERTVSYQVAELDMRGAIDEMAKHAANMEMIQSNRAKYLIVGRDQMKRLDMQDWAIRNLGTRQIPFGVAYGDGTERRYLYGLEIILVPYIDGCFVLPDLEKNRL